MRERYMSASKRDDRDVLMDISRLIWRVWRRGLPTGIDRVCLAYLCHFAPRSLALVQWKGMQFVLSSRDSDSLFRALVEHGTSARWRLAALAVSALSRCRRSAPKPGMLYLNVGHTGLNDPALPRWISANGVRAIYMIHDLIPITHPQYCRPGESEKHVRRMNNALASAAGVIANSQSSLDDLAAHARQCGLQMPPSIVAWISGGQVPTMVEAKSIGRPYFVTVGTIEGRKNHLLLLEVWKRLVADLGQEAPVLAIIGRRGWQAKEAHAILDQLGSLEGHVIELNHCDDKNLAAWIRGARAVLMPSFAEGFGLPIVEALELGAPVIASNLPVFREIAGDIPKYLDPRDASAWEQSVRSSISSTLVRDRRQAARERFQGPNWVSHFEAIERWLKGSELEASPQRNSLG